MEGALVGTCRVIVLITYLFAVSKYLTWDLKKKGLNGLTVKCSSHPCQRSWRRKSGKQIVTWYLQSGRKEWMLSFSIFIFSKTLANGIALPTVGLGLPSLETPSQIHIKVCFLVSLHPVQMTFSKYITVVIFTFIHNCWELPPFPKPHTNSWICSVFFSCTS